MLQTVLEELSKKEELPSNIILLRKICQAGFLEFCLAVKPDYIATKFHKAIANKLQKFYEEVRDGKDQNIMLEMQPQIGKSTLVSELFPAWVLGKEAWPVIVASYGSDLAQQKSSNCRDIVNSDVYQMIFPDSKLNPETAAKDYWKTTNGGSYRAVGVGGGLTGFQGKLLICDDPIKDFAEAESTNTLDSIWKWWQTVFMSRKQSKSGVLLCNTRWNLQDVSGRILAKELVDKSTGLQEHQYDHWERLSFPAFADEDEYIDGILFRKKGEVLCPERFTYDDMVKRRNNTDIQEWSSLYMQTPILAENAEFKKEWIKFFDDGMIATKDLICTTTVDLAISQKQKADNTVVLTVGKERTTGYWFLLDIIGGHFDPLETIDAIFTHAKRFRSKVWVESVGYQASLQYFIIEEQRKKQTFFEINELAQKNTRSKEQRIRGLIPMFKAGMIFIRQGDLDLINEMLQFPMGKHDDFLDCLSMQLDVVSNTGIILTPQQKKQLEDEDKVEFDPHSAFTRI